MGGPSGDPATTWVTEPAGIEDLQAIVADLPDFWGERDTASLHHSLYVHEFGDTALVVREPQGRVAAYLLGFITPARIGYVHVVGVRRAHRRMGLARSLYDEFAALAGTRGASALKAITTSGNEGSLAFHRSLGFTGVEVAGYSASGEARIVMSRQLASGAAAGRGTRLSN